MKIFLACRFYLLFRLEKEEGKKDFVTQDSSDNSRCVHRPQNAHANDTKARKRNTRLCTLKIQFVLT